MRSIARRTVRSRVMGRSPRVPSRRSRAVAQVSTRADFPITIEGHTGNLPISTSRFPSNWELSAVRASSVVRLFIDAGVRGALLTAAGYGDQRPLAPNDDEAGRARNRRVTLLIESMLGDPPPRAPGRIPADDPIRAILPAAGRNIDTAGRG